MSAATLVAPGPVSLVPRPRPVWPILPATPSPDAWVDLAVARAALRAATALTTSLIRAIPDPAFPIPGSAWTVGDAAAHLVVGAQIAVDCLAGFPSPIHDLGARREHEARFLARFPERRPAVLAAVLVDAVDLLVEAPLDDAVDLLVEAPLDDEFIPYHAAIPLDPGVIISLVAAEMIAHGWDIARTLGLPWSIEPSVARVASTATIRMLPHLLAESAASVEATYRIHIRGGDDITCRLHRGALTVSRRDIAPVDCHVSADPVAFVLVAHRRISRLGRVARGQLVSWGRNPALGAALPGLFVTP